jgi:FkbM family methyltransferase
VIHVGANEGQERETYAKRGLNVLWIEPIPDVYARLVDSLRDYPSQIARNALITDREGEEYVLNIANNGGLSSSIFGLAMHREIFSRVDFSASITLSSITLDTLVDAPDVKRSSYDALILDVQGAELLVLRGATRTLQQMQYVKIEAANFESYRGGTNADELDGFMRSRGFRMISSDKFAEMRGVGSYFDLLFTPN